MTEQKFTVQPGDTLISFGTGGQYKGVQVVTVERVTPTGRFLVVEYPHHTYEAVSRADYALLRGHPSNALAPFRLKRPAPEHDLDALRADFAAWIAAQAVKVERHQRMLSVRIKAERLLEDSKAHWGDRSVRQYPYTDNQIDLLDQLLTEMNATAKAGSK